ncbi:MAG: class I SAM-dependent methyltransferase [Proteobacteria bacterium]|nr:class I SAM-dependent methyltransferase [Pseudomonadota bacterium]
MALTCRFCGEPLTHTFVDLGVSPVSNAFVSADRLDEMEPFFPLHARVCGKCLLVQLPAFEAPAAIFNEEYAYFSSFSDSWLAHCRQYAREMVPRLSLSPQSLVVELASNDGYLLQFFREQGVPVLGVEPAKNVAEAAREKGVETVCEFFGSALAGKLVSRGVRANLLVGNNVLAHVPDVNDFVEGMKILLAEGGVITMEFPHLLRLMEENQFDTIYHEHFSYFSFLAASQLFAAHGLFVFDVDELPTHGGSLRIHAAHVGECRKATARVAALAEKERAAGLHELSAYRDFAPKVHAVKRKLLSFLIAAREEGKTVAGYGAPAKGNTLLNYCGVRADLLDYTVDKSPRKQGTFLPGTRIPVFGPEKIAKTRPDYVLILPWNLAGEITEQMAHIREWGGRFVVPIPEIRVLP